MEIEAGCGSLLTPFITHDKPILLELSITVLKVQDCKPKLSLISNTRLISNTVDCKV